MSTDPRTGALAPEAWEHTSLVTRDIDRAVAFYRAAFGYEIVWEGRNWTRDIDDYLGTQGVSADIVMVRSPVSGHTLELVAFRAVPAAQEERLPTRPGSGHVAFRVADVEHAVEVARGLGAELVGDIQVSPGVGRGCYLREPSGTFVELTDLEPGNTQVGLSIRIEHVPRLRELLEAVGASRTTLRLEPEECRRLEVGERMPVIAEALADGVPSLLGGVSLDIREGPTLPRMIETLGNLVVEDCDTSPYAPPQKLRDVYGVDAEMLGPLVHHGRLVGMVSVHYNDGPRAWTPEQIALLDAACAAFTHELGLEP